MEVLRLAGQEPQEGTGDPHDDSYTSFRLLIHVDIWYFSIQEDPAHPLVDLPHVQHHPHGIHLHLLDLLLILHQLTAGHRISSDRGVAAGPVDSHVEGGLPLLHIHHGL